MLTNRFLRSETAVALLLALIAVTGCSSLRSVTVTTGGAGEGRGSGEDRGSVTVAFSRADTDAIRAWYRNHGLPPGLAKKSELPPGHQRQLRRSGTLPPGIAHRVLPEELEVRLAKLPEGYVRILVAGDVVLMNTETRVVVDIVQGVGGA